MVLTPTGQWPSPKPLPPLLLQHRVSTLRQAQLSWPGSSPEPQVAPSQRSPHPQLPQGVFTLPCRCSQRLPAFPGTVVPSLRERSARPRRQASGQVEVGGESRQEWPGTSRFPAKSCLSAALRRGGESIPVYWQSPAKVREDRRSQRTGSSTRSRTSSLGLEGRGQRETTWVQVRPL